MDPGYYYFLAMLLVVLPSMLVNRRAVLVAACWLPGLVASKFGVPAAPADMVVDILAIGVGAAISRNAADFGVTAFFFPMAALNMADGLHSIDAYYAWWLLFWIAMAQIAVIPFGNNWVGFGRMFDSLKRKVLT